MNHRMSLIAFGASTVVLAWLLTGCDDNNSDDEPSSGGDAGTVSDTDTDTDSDTDADADGDCANVTPCGGDVVGTWNVTSSCVTVSGETDMTALGLGCASAPVTGSLQVSGTWTAGADGAYTDSTTTTGTVQINLPCSCLAVSGTCTNCARISGPLSAAGYASVACEDDPTADTTDCNCGGGCICTATVDQAGGIGVAPGYPSASGVYTTSGNTLTITADTQEYSYCVSGTTLTMTPVSSDLTGTLTGSVALQKQ